MAKVERRGMITCNYLVVEFLLGRDMRDPCNCHGKQPVASHLFSPVSHPGAVNLGREGQTSRGDR